MAKSIDIKPLDDGCFIMKNSRGDSFSCFDADKVGELIETAIWPLIESGLKRRRPISIKVEIDEKNA